VVIFRSLFYASVTLLFYVYAGYPLLVLLLARLRPRPVRRSPHRPRITILIAAHNESETIEATLANKLDLDYPADRLEIIVVSDGSTDPTVERVRSFADRGVKLLEQHERQGKTAALNRGVELASGEIVAFADANSIWEREALTHLADTFHDAGVGYVTGTMVYTDPSGSVIGDGCSTYMRYENRLRTWETSLGSVVGVDGGIDAVRRSLYRPMNPDQLPDFVLPLQVVERGYRVVYEPRAVLREPALNTSGDEYRMRVRVSLRSLWALRDMRVLLNPFRFGLFSWQLVSHKVLRYGCFAFLALAFASNLALARESSTWATLMALQIVGYTAMLISYLLERAGKPVGLLYAPYYFTLINVASAHAFLKFVAGRKQVLWTPRKG